MQMTTTEGSMTTRTSPTTIETRRGNGQQKETLFLCPDGVYRSFKALHAYRRRMAS